MNALKKSLSSGEYEAQFFDTASLCLVHEIREFTLNDVERATNKLKKQLISKCGGCDHSECENLIRELRAKYEKSVDYFFHVLEPSINEIFCIPSHVLLPEDAKQKAQYDEQDVLEIENEIRLLSSRYRKAICLESLLKKEKKSSSCVDIIEKKTLEIEDNIRVLEKIFERNSSNFIFLSDQLTELMNLANQVTPISFTEKTLSDHLNEKFRLSN